MNAHPFENSFTPPTYKWQVYPFGRAAKVAVQLQTAPNWFNRWMQRLVFGFVWERVS